MGNDVAENTGPETKVGQVSVLHWNCRSISHKLDHLQIISNDSSIICATESHVDENIYIFLTTIIFDSNAYYNQLHKPKLLMKQYIYI